MKLPALVKFVIVNIKSITFGINVVFFNIFNITCMISERYR